MNVPVLLDVSQIITDTITHESSQPSALKLSQVLGTCVAQKRILTTRFKAIRIFFLASTALVASSPALFGQTTEWIGGDGDWNKGSNWSNGAAPIYRDNVIINTLEPNSPIISPDENDSFSTNLNTLTIGEGTGQSGYLMLDAEAPNSGIFFVMPYDAEHGFTVGKSGGKGVLNVKLAGDFVDPDIKFDSIWFDSDLTVGSGAGSNGTVNILSNGKDASAVTRYDAAVGLRTGSGYVGYNGGTGVVNIIDSAWGLGMSHKEKAIGAFVGDGTKSHGTLNVLSGGKLAMGTYGPTIENPDGLPTGVVVGIRGGTGILNVIGRNGTVPSVVHSALGFNIGHGANSHGTANILAGGKMSSVDSFYHSPPGYIFNNIGSDGGTGSILVSDAGSTLLIGGETYSPYPFETTTTGDLHIGNGGHGTLTIAKGALVHVGTGIYESISTQNNSEAHKLTPDIANGIVYLAHGSGATGTINYGAAAGDTAVSAGTLNAAGVVFGSGNGRLNFNHTDTNLQIATPLSGKGRIDVIAGTTWINSDNDEGFTHIRKGFDQYKSNIIDVSETFTEGLSGQTNLYGGTLGLGHSHALGNSDIYARNDANLAYGAGTSLETGVKIDNKITVEPNVTLNLQVKENISAEQSGAIGGTGNLTKTDAGTLSLSADNSLSGEVKISAGTLALSGAGEVSQAKRVIANSVFDISKAVDGASIRSLSGSGIAELGKQTLTITSANDLFSGIIQGDGGLTVAGGVQSLSGKNTYSGNTMINGATLKAAAANTFSPNSFHMIDAKGVLDLNDYNQFVPELHNAGFVRFGSTPGTVMSVNNYAGTGGSLLMNTTLNDDNSVSDRLMIDGGRATGTSSIKVTNVGGLGAKTKADGILLVGVLNGGTTEKNAFDLNGRAIAGPYEYSLLRGGIDGNNSDQWYLRSLLDCSLDPGSDICKPVIPIDPIEPGIPNPEYRGEVSLYTALPSLALKYGNATVDSLHERMGVTRMTADSGTMGWGRVIGVSGSKDSDGLGIYGNNGPAYDYNIAAMQTGMDLYQSEAANGSITQAGIHGAFGRTTADVDNFNGKNAGRVELDAWSLGLYLTHVASAGWYVDSIIQGTYYDAAAASSGGQSLKTNGYGLIASVETGYPFQLQNSWTLEPQAQLTYQLVNLDDTGDGAALEKFSKVQSL